MTLKRFPIIVLLGFTTQIASGAPPKTNPAAKESKALRSTKLHAEDIVFLALRQTFHILAPEKGAFPEITAAEGNLAPGALGSSITTAKCQVRFEKNYAPEPDTIKKVNPQVERKERMYEVRESNKGMIRLSSIAGAWNAYGPPIREITCTDPAKQKSGEKLTLEDVHKIFKASAAVHHGNRNVRIMMASWREIMKRVPMETPQACNPNPEPALPQPSPAPAAPLPAEELITPEPSNADQESVNFSSFATPSFEVPLSVAPLTRGEAGLIKDKLAPLLEENKKFWPQDEQLRAIEYVVDALNEKKAAGNLLSIDESNRLLEAERKAESLRNALNDYQKSEDAMIQRLSDQFPGHINEIYEIFWCSLNPQWPGCEEGTPNALRYF